MVGFCFAVQTCGGEEVEASQVSGKTGKFWRQEDEKAACGEKVWERDVKAREFRGNCSVEGQYNPLLHLPRKTSLD